MAGRNINQSVSTLPGAGHAATDKHGRHDLDEATSRRSFGETSCSSWSDDGGCLCKKARPSLNLISTRRIRNLRVGYKRTKLSRVNKDKAELWPHSTSERVMFKVEVAEPGFGHFSKYRPKFYRMVLTLSGMDLRRGTINVRIDGEMPRYPQSNTQRIPAQDQIDFDDNQDILITPCVMEGRPGFWILP